MKNFWQKSIDSGFSLLEIVVTLSLLAISLVAIITVATKILQIEYITENDFVAKGLLIEGIELAEARRNLNVSSSTLGVPPFYQDLATTSPSDGSVYSFTLDYNGNFSQVGALPNASARLKYDDTNFYQLITGTDTKFYRRIVSTYNNTKNAKGSLDIEAQVYWADRGGKSNIQKLSSTLTNTTTDGN